MNIEGELIKDRLWTHISRGLWLAVGAVVGGGEGSSEFRTGRICCQKLETLTPGRNFHVKGLRETNLGGAQAFLLFPFCLFVV